jgi:hypothetical protein
MSLLKKDHFVGTGSAALAAGATGAAIGAAVAGPPGLAIGAAVGGVLGAVLGTRASEAADSRQDLGHFEQIYHTMPYYIDGCDWHDYAPAYRYGMDTFEQHPGQAMEQVDSQLHGGWESAARFGSRLSWEHARPAVAHAWQSLSDAVKQQPVIPNAGR